MVSELAVRDHAPTPSLGAFVVPWRISGDERGARRPLGMGPKRRSRASKERAASWVGEADAEETVVGGEGILVGHGSATRIG
jgi:hypothetical protein